MNIWKKAKDVKLELDKNCEPGFDPYCDEGVDESVLDELDSFMSFVDDNYPLKTKINVDFLNSECIKTDDGKEMGYIFDYINFENYPKFESDDNAPIIKLPVSLNDLEIGDIIYAFCEVMTYYYSWVLNEIESYKLNEDDVEEIFNEYLKYREELE